jgi:DNA invertase Pin-like site-specific DNA recombinase
MATEVFSYLRVSGKGQIEGDGFTRQRKAIKDYCKSHGFKVKAEFRDEGVSGTKDGFDRDGLTELMIALKSNGVRTFIVENASRLARDLMIQEIILSDCRKHGITVLESSGIDLTVSDNDPTRKLVRQILGAVAEFEKSSLVQKLAASRKRIRKKGQKCEGAKSYLECNHPAVEIISKMRTGDKSKKRESFQTISDYLNESKISTLRGGLWTRQQVNQVWNQIKLPIPS